MGGSPELDVRKDSVHTWLLNCRVWVDRLEERGKRGHGDSAVQRGTGRRRNDRGLPISATGSIREPASIRVSRW